MSLAAGRMVRLKAHRIQRLPHERGSTRSKQPWMHVTCTHTANTLHHQRRRRIARNMSAHRKPLAPALKAPKVIVLLGVLCGHHDALLGWTKISVFERGDAPAPEHRGARRAVGRSSRGAWAMRVSGHATHRWSFLDPSVTCASVHGSRQCAGEQHWRSPSSGGWACGPPDGAGACVRVPRDWAEKRTRRRKKWPPSPPPALFSPVGPLSTMQTYQTTP